MHIEQLIIPAAGNCTLAGAEWDDALTADEVLIRTHAALLCDGPAVSAFQGDADTCDSPYSIQAGLVGEVVAGTALPAGMLVTCRAAVASHAKVRAIECAPVPEDMGNEKAVFFAPAQNALASVRVAPPRLGENVVVLGQGVHGNLMAQMYRLSGAGQVLVVDRSAQRLATAQQCGIEKCLDASTSSLAAGMGELAPRGAELLCVAEEGLSLLSEAMPLVAPHGLVVLQTVPDQSTAQHLWKRVVERSLVVLGAPGAKMTDAQRSADTPMLLDWLASGRLWTEPLCTQKRTVAQARETLLDLQNRPGETIGVILEF